ncbi:ABC transporter permease, partial [Xanthovirga aplysinae]|uniref:ABC transporter permease n=1 Tax=Xanthovirga aplysinae TaxID=2529853 RepID=UPI0012BBF952
NVLFRVLLKYKNLTFLSIIGLSAGFSLFLLSLTFIFQESNYDTHLKEGSQIYRIVEELKSEDQTVHQANSAPLMAPEITATFPEAKSFVRFAPYNQNLMIEGRGFEEEVTYVDENVFSFFELNLNFGDANTALKEPNSLVLTKQMAIKLFGKENALGELVEIELEKPWTFKVTGILEDQNKYSHLEFDILASMATFDNSFPGFLKAEDSWFNNSFYSYIKLNDNLQETALRLESKLPDFVSENIPQEKFGMYYNLTLQPLKEIYLYSNHLFDEWSKRGSLMTLKFLLILSLIVVGVSLINYTNMLISINSRRFAEVGIKKILSASNQKIIKDFLMESLLMSLLVILISTCLACVFLPFFNDILFTELLTKQLFNTPFLIFIVVAISTCVLAGFYPAFILSKSRPLEAIKGKIQGLKVNSFGKALI